MEDVTKKVIGLVAAVVDVNEINNDLLSINYKLVHALGDMADRISDEAAQLAADELIEEAAKIIERTLPARLRVSEALTAFEPERRPN